MSDASPQSAAPNGTTAAKKYNGIFALVCVYGGDVATVYINHKIGKVKEIRNKLREQYGAVAQFHTISTMMPPGRWPKWETEIRTQLGLPPKDAPGEASNAGTASAEAAAARDAP